MFKYLWLVVAVIAYSYWVSVVARQVINEIKYSRQTGCRFKLKWCGLATEAYIWIHFVLIMSWSIALFVLDFAK